MTEIVWCEDCERPKDQCECVTDTTSDTRRFDYLTHRICLAAEQAFGKERDSAPDWLAEKVKGLLQDLRDNLTKANRRNYTIDLLEREIERLRGNNGNEPRS